MSLIWADIPSGSNGLYGGNINYMFDGIWSAGGASLVDDPDPNITGYVLQFGSSMRYALPAGPTNTVGIASRVYIPSLPALDNQRPAIHQFRDISNNPRLVVLVATTGALQVYRDCDATTGVGTLIGQTAAPVITANSWRHVETKVVWGTTTGEVEIRVEGVTKLHLTNVNTGAGNYAQVAIGNSYSLTGVLLTSYAKDIVFWDTAGSENNDFLGSVGVYFQPPNADVSSGWSRSSGSTDYGLVDEAPPNDAGYIYAGTPAPSPSIMNVEPLPADVVAIRGFFPIGRSEKTDGGDGKLQMSVSPNGTDWDDGADNPQSTAFTYYYDVSEVSPDTTDPWTVVEFSTLQFKFNRTL